MKDPRFGVSTHLFHNQQLTRDDLVHVAAHGFEAVELFATRSHFDYRNGQAIDLLAEWLSDTRLELHSVHAPIVEAMKNGQWVGPFSTASADDARRRAAVAETEAALCVAAKVPFRFLVVHLGLPSSIQAPPRDNQLDAAVRSVEEIVELASAAGVKVALEVMPNSLSSASALTQLVEERLEGTSVGVCLDYGHAHLMGDVCETIETLSGHLWTTHVHDNRGRSDDHLAPFAGSIDWPAAMMATQKIGYDDVLMFEVTNSGDPVEVLRRLVTARERLEKTFAF